MENQHKHIKGYCDLTAADISLMNEIEAEGEKLEVIIDKLMADPTTDKRWVSIGRTNLQQGIMALVRSVAQPTTF